MEKYQQGLIKAVKEAIAVEEVIVMIPPDPKLGDLALPCFPFAKAMRKSPAEIAGELKSKINLPDFIEKVEIAGGYLNFFIKKSVLVQETIAEIKAKGMSYGSSMRGRGKKALVEHTSINPNASPHVGRARNAFIGDTIVRLLKFEGYEVDTHYFVNDVGKQIAMLLLGARGKSAVSFKDLLNIYVEINEKVKENPELEKEVFHLLYKLENGDAEVKEKFREIVDICIKGQTKLLEELDIRYDTFTYESDYIWSKRVEAVLRQLKDTGKLQEDPEGRWVLNQEEYGLPMKAPFLVLTRADKTSLYPLRDIAYTIDKIKTGADTNIVVLGEDQKLYFQQIAAVMDLFGYKAPSSVHYSFVLLSEGKMSTRKGTVVLLEDFMKEAVQKSKEEIGKRHEAVDEKTAKSIAYGAVKYAILRVANEKNVTFDWEAALSFEGDAGPYLQYSYARINSIFRRYGKPLPESADFSLLETDIELELVKELAGFSRAVGTALQELSPHTVANYVYGIAKKFSTFYHACPVMHTENEALTEARLLLIEAVRQVVKNCLWLLGIDAVEVM